MSYVIFCKGRKADKPYWIEDLKIYIDSLEELCYYIYSNASLCDRELLKPELAVWLERQCALPDLAGSLKVVLQKDTRPERIAAQILNYADYLTRQEREVVCEKIRKYSMLGLHERRKMRGDYLYLDGKYQDAIACYEEMIVQKAYDNEKMQHSLLYNIGCCYGAMFYFDIAYGWFLQAAALNVAKEEDIMAALFCKRMSLDDKAWKEYLSAHEEMAAFAPPMEKRMKEVEEAFWKSPSAREFQSFQKGTDGRKKDYYTYMAQCLEEWKCHI